MGALITRKIFEGLAHLRKGIDHIHRSGLAFSQPMQNGLLKLIKKAA